MIKYLKLKPMKIKVKGIVHNKYPHLHNSINYSKKINEKSGYEYWIIKDKEEKINRFLNEKLSNPRFKTEDSKKIDTWTGKEYKDLTELKKVVSKEEIDNPGELIVITETEAKKCLKSGEKIEDFHPEKTEKEILLDKIKKDSSINNDVKNLLEKLIKE